MGIVPVDLFVAYQMLLVQAWQTISAERGTWLVFGWRWEHSTSWHACNSRVSDVRPKATRRGPLQSKTTELPKSSKAHSHRHRTKGYPSLT